MAGFIGFHLTQKLLNEGFSICGIDNLNNYYSPKLKIDRLKELGFFSDVVSRNGFLTKSENYSNLYFINLSIEDKPSLIKVFNDFKFDYIIHLAAQAGVRYSIENPEVYINSNIIGFFNILECCKVYQPKHLIFASSSSIYGLNKKVPFSEIDRTDQPASLYAATKKSNELMAHTYSYLFGIPITGLRFFTVYGPWGRPDMAYFKFTKKILEEEEIELYNYGKMKRDFTYIDDIVEAINKLIHLLPDKNINNSVSVPFEVYNIGNNNPVELKKFVSILEDLLGKKAKIRLMPLQKGEVVETYADIKNLYKKIGYKPATKIEDGLKNFVTWYKKYYNI